MKNEWKSEFEATVTQAIQPDDVYSASQAAELMQCGKSNVIKALKAGRMQAQIIRHGSMTAYVISGRAILDFLSRNRSRHTSKRRATVGAA